MIMESLPLCIPLCCNSKALSICCSGLVAQWLRPHAHASKDIGLILSWCDASSCHIYPKCYVPMHWRRQMNLETWCTRPHQLYAPYKRHPQTHTTIVSNNEYASEIPPSYLVTENFIKWSLVQRLTFHAATQKCPRAIAVICVLLL